eukprot:GHVT01085852.1.p1 GENE.GHVT01085852.1~~GHVT01085852.1.p1  ORF type:complete len:172 (+),score=11.04 GHVT01085852.1:219-734(+)
MVTGNRRFGTSLARTAPVNLGGMGATNPCAFGAMGRREKAAENATGLQALPRRRSTCANPGAERRRHHKRVAFAHLSTDRAVRRGQAVAGVALRRMKIIGKFFTPARSATPGVVIPRLLETDQRIKTEGEPALVGDLNVLEETSRRRVVVDCMPANDFTLLNALGKTPSLV